MKEKEMEKINMDEFYDFAWACEYGSYDVTKNQYYYCLLNDKPCRIDACPKYEQKEKINK